MSFICLYLGCRWFRVRGHTALASVHFKPRVSSLHVFGQWDATGQLGPVWACPHLPMFHPTARLSGRQPRVLPLRISFGGSSSSSDILSFSFACRGSDHFPFHWLPFHDHRDVENATEIERKTNYVCYRLPQKRARTTDQSAATRSPKPQKKTFMRALEEGVLNETSGPSVNIIVMLVNRTPGYVTASVMQAVDKAQTELKT